MKLENWSLSFNIRRLIVSVDENIPFILVKRHFPVVREEIKHCFKENMYRTYCVGRGTGVWILWMVLCTYMEAALFPGQDPGKSARRKCYFLPTEIKYCWNIFYWLREWGMCEGKWKKMNRKSSGPPFSPFPSSPTFSLRRKKWRVKCLSFETREEG